MASLRKYESGSRKPKIETLSKIANALDISLSDLVESDSLNIANDIIELFVDSPPHEIMQTPEETTLQASLNFAFQMLNITGKRKLSDYAQDLTEIKRYTAPDTPPDHPDQG